MRGGIALLTWREDGFAYADSYDETEGRYRALRFGQQLEMGAGETGLLVKPDIAAAQTEPVVEPPGTEEGDGEGVTGVVDTGGQPGSGPEGTKPTRTAPKRYHGNVTLDPARVGRDASVIAEEVVAHLAGLMGANVTVTLEINADMPDGAPETVVRTVLENSRQLKFTSQGFEED